MLVQLSLASLMVVLTVFIHLLGMALLVRMLRSHHRLLLRFNVTPLAILVCATLGLVLVHTVEIWLYALLYVWLEAAQSFEEALYFSTVTYATVGYGDILLAKNWRILGAIEGATGIIMLGWSTAFLVSLLTQLKLFSHDWLEPESTPPTRRDKQFDPDE